LQDLASQGILKERYPDLDILGLTNHVDVYTRRLAGGNESRHTGRFAKRISRIRAEIRQRGVSQQAPDQTGVCKRRRQPEHLTPEKTSASAGGNPVRSEYGTDEVADAGAGRANAESVDKFDDRDSDESDASTFGLRNASQDIEECDEQSESSSGEDSDKTITEWERVTTWRMENLLLDDMDFAYAYVDFKEAYSNAGRAVAEAWSRTRFLAERQLVPGMAELSILEVTVNKKRKIVKAPFLRQPGKGAQHRHAGFVDLLAHLMMDCRVKHAENASASEEEIAGSLRCKATRVAEAAEMSTLHKVAATVGEIRKHLQDRAVQTGVHTGLDGIEPTVLEEFLRQSHAQVRAVSAIGWMCSNLHLGWPMDKVKKPDTYEAVLIDNEHRQAPAAQPGMITALADAIVAGTEDGNPFWLALLASWLQAMASLRPSHVLCRSVPVELFDGWILFFCMRGKRECRHAGFYWGVPSETPCGFNWTTKFLEVYEQRRQSDAGKAMRGMIFRTDTFEAISAESVNALSMNVVPDVLVEPRAVTTYSWKRLLTTMALHLNFSASERSAIGDWKDAKAGGDEAPITSRYAEEKEGRSRTCKLICAEVLSSLASRNIRTFDEVSARQWDEMAAEARAEVEGKLLEVNVRWRNQEVMRKLQGGRVRSRRIQDVAETRGDSKVMKSQITSLKRSGCKGSNECQLVLHKCAADCQGGRTGHGSYPGPECKTTRRHAGRGEGDSQRNPAQMRTEVDGSARQAVREPGEEELTSDGIQATAREEPSRGPADPGKVGTPGYVEDDSIMKELVPKLSEGRYERRGSRRDPEPPRLVAKICRQKGRGELWLGPLPTAQRMKVIIETKPSIQIYCLSSSPTNVQTEPGGEWGELIPWTRAFRFDIAEPCGRSRELRALRECVVNSLKQGDNAYVHCISGISEAPMAAALLSAMLMKISFEAAQGIINQVRNVSFGKSEDHMLGNWIDTLLREDIPGGVIPTGFSGRAVDKDEMVVHAMAATEGSTEPICRIMSSRQRQRRGRKHECWEASQYSIAVGSVEEAVNQFGGRFCGACEGWLKESLKIQVKQLFDPVNNAER